MGELAKFLIERLKRKEQAHVEETDRISSLPVELRVHILSFLRIKEAVQTCVLSKTWRKTWVSLPILFFNSKEFLLDDPIHSLSDEARRQSEYKFVKFIEAVLQEREASDALSHFVLLSETKDCVSCNSEAFKDCILSALKFKPRLLAVAGCNHKMLSSYDIFSCVSLEEVYFQNNRGAPFQMGPNSVCLPRLKRLDLVRVTVNDDFLDKLFLGCPIMEELMLHSCVLSVFRISCGRLKRLGLFNCCFTMWIILTLPCTDVTVNFPRTTLVSRPHLISILSNVTWLNLALPGTLVKGLFENGVPRWPIFKNLKRLKLGGWHLNSNFDLVAFFLRSPNLQMLTLHGNNAEEVDTATDDKSNWEEPKAVMFQRVWLLKVLIMKQGKSDEWVHQLIKNLRAHVKTIGEIVII